MGQHVDPSQQVITLCNERFLVPEALFHPSDIGIRQGGIVEATSRCLRSFAPGLRTLLKNNIVLTGGSTRIRGFSDRFTYPYDCCG